MPYKSDSQRRWAHTEKGEKALGGPKAVDEWDQASKGKDLPEHVPGAADGGIVSDTKETVSYTPPEPNGQIPEESMGIEDKIANFLKNLYGAGPLSHDKNEAAMADAIEPENPMLHTASNTQGFADGGVVDSDVPQFDPQAGMPITPAVPPQLPTPSPQEDITPYLAAQKNQINKYGPEQQLATEAAIRKGQNSPLSLAGQGLAGLGDAIVQGVSRAGNPGFLNAVQGRQERQGQQQLEALKGAQEANVQNIGQTQKLDAMDPNSPLSASKRQQNGPILEVMGFDPKTIGQMSAAEMDTTLSILQNFRGKELETAVARYKAQIEANQLAETTRQHTAENTLKARELDQTAKQQAAENALKAQGIQAGQVEHAASLPFVSRVAGAIGLNPAGKALQDEALGNPTTSISHVTNQAEYDALPVGAHYVDASGQRKVKGTK